MLRTALALLALSGTLLLGCPAGEPDPEPTPEPTPEAPTPGEFQAGAAVVRMTVPIGISTSGNSPLEGPDSDSPYSDRFPASRRLHGHPDVRAVVYSRGEGFELAVVRVDMIGAVEQMRDALVAELFDRTGIDYDDSLVLGATHTHSGPARFIQPVFFSVIADYFHAAHYERIVGLMADAVMEARADLAPAEFALVHASAPDAHIDRRCEDGDTDYTNDDTPLLVVRKDGAIESIVMTYAIHGTVLGPDDLNISQDVSGAIETFTELALEDEDAMVMMINSWAADAGPGSPSVTPLADATPLPTDYARIEEVGEYMGSVVTGALDSAEWTTEPAVQARTYRYLLDRMEIGYGFDEFPFEYGGVYCVGEVDCNEPPPYEPLENIANACIPFPEHSPAPMQSMVTVGAIGDAHFLTWGGECGTKLAETTMASFMEVDGVDDVVFFGYSNDYMGYGLHEEDWYFGGYEASGSMWGPKQGDYMALRAVQSFRDYMGVETASYTAAPPIELFDLSVIDPVLIETALEVGTIVEQPVDAGPGETVTATIYGADPWWGTPLATLQRDDGGVWVDVVTPTGRTVTSDGYGFWVDLSPDPDWTDADELPMTRHFSYTYSLPRTSRYGEAIGLTPGSYRLSIVVPEDGETETVITTDAFALE